MPEIIYGIKPVLATLRANPRVFREILISREGQSRLESAVLQEARKSHVKYSILPKEALTARANTRKHQGVVGIIDPYQYLSLESFLNSWVDSSRKDGLLVALDGIQDPQNLGAIIRSAEVFGTQAVIIPKDRSVSVSSGVYKAAAGALAYTSIIQVTNMVRTLERLKSENFWVIGLSPDGEKSIFEMDLSLSLVFVVGNESQGLRHLVKASCDWLARIPMSGKIRSLNASAATAIALAETTRQRGLNE